MKGAMRVDLLCILESNCIKIAFVRVENTFIMAIKNQIFKEKIV